MYYGMLRNGGGVFLHKVPNTALEPRKTSYFMSICYSNAYEGKAKSSWTFLITFIIDVRLFLYFHKCNNGLLSTFM